MHEPVETQLYLTAPPLDSARPASLAQVLSMEAVACLFLDISGFVEGDVTALETLIEVAATAECPLVVGGDDTLALDLARRFALDGVHLSANPKQVGWARKQLGTDAIIGFGAGTSRESALAAAEAGADYVSMGPFAALEPDLPSWWQAVIETPLVVEGVDTPEAEAATKSVADFVLLDAGFWAGDPVGRVTGWAAAEGV